jgi:hypothetical protein
MDPQEPHEWVSFEIDGATYVFDLTFLTSRWTCIFGAGCLGVLTAPAPELVHGCCTYGAHFTGKKDRKRVLAQAERLTAEQWQYREEAERRGGAVHKNEDGAWISELVDGACIFLNRPGFATGPGCALHQAAWAADERPLDWKPEVCWQLPLRLDSHVDDNSHVTWTLREWKRRDWGEGGQEFHWWCTEGPEAFVGASLVYETLRDEIVELVGEAPYEALCAHLKERPAIALLPHPAVRRRAPSGKTRPG